MLTSEFSNVFSDCNTSEMESRNCLRRIARHDETEFSNQSIMNAMETFVKAVNDMDETILVPCRLMDLKVGDGDDTTVLLDAKGRKGSVRELGSTDLYSLYTMVNSVKNELLWGQGCEEETSTTTTTTTAAVAARPAKGHVRRPSTVSLTSTNSAASISDTDSETGNENDSGIEDSQQQQQQQCPDHARQVAENFRRHLGGLYRSLRQMTDAASYLTTRYQHDIGGAV